MLKCFLFAVIFLSPVSAVATPQDSTNCDGCRTIGLPDWQLMTDQCIIWSPSVGLEDPSSPYTRACVTTTTDYTLTIISDEGALLVQDTFRVARGELYVSLSADQEVPNICTADSVVLVSIVTSDTDYSLQWSTGDTMPIIEVREAGLYSLSVTNTGGCTVVDTIRVNNQDARPLSLNSSDPDQQLSCGETAQLSVTGTYSSY
ncbi:MAG TPA: hypothetical protein VJ953_05695, partial [Saprospiraceae bacterium]|nr:hypothetical protein [Saprospiraceae bacterium]